MCDSDNVDARDKLIKEMRDWNDTMINFKFTQKPFAGAAPLPDVPNFPKDRDLMFICLEYAHDICVPGTPEEVLAFAKQIYEWIK
jgi:hypothetical protein